MEQTYEEKNKEKDKIIANLKQKLKKQDDHQVVSEILKPQENSKEMISKLKLEQFSKKIENLYRKKQYF